MEVTPLVSTPADWLAPDALVVGFLTVTTDGLSFRSLIFNPARVVTIDIVEVDRVILSSVSAKDPRAVEVVVAGRGTFVFLVADPRTVARAIEQAMTARTTRTIYR